MSVFYLPNKEMDSRLLNIRKSIMSLMNGKTSEYMETSGIFYKKNYGVSLVHLKDYAKTIEPLNGLEDRLWKSGVREMMIIATIISMPISKEKLDNWVKDIKNIEIAEIASMYLFCKTEEVCSWIEDVVRNNESGESYELITALTIANRVKGTMPSTLFELIKSTNFPKNYFISQAIERINS